MDAIVSPAGAGSLAVVLNNLAQTQQSLSALTAETSSGYIASTYAGLGANAGVAIDLTSQLALNTTLQANATAAANIQQVTQTALGQINTLVSGVASQLLGAATSSTGGLSTIASSAKSALQQIAGLLDTQVGGVYIFAGQDSTNPPVPDPQNVAGSAFATAIQNALAALPASGAAAVQAQLIAIASPGGTSPFSATLEASRRPATVDLGNGERVQVGVLANQNTDAVSAGVGTTSTGAYVRDIFLGLSTLGALNGSDPTNAQVASLLSGLQTTLSGADAALNVDIGGVGVRQNAITNAQTELTAVSTALTSQLGSVQDVNQTSVATQLSATESQLQDSYAIIAALGKLTLSTYIA